jgi:xanthine/uracil/vitamin C permease (AzgA family)
MVEKKFKSKVVAAFVATLTTGRDVSITLGQFGGFCIISLVAASASRLKKVNNLPKFSLSRKN